MPTRVSFAASVRADPLQPAVAEGIAGEQFAPRPLPVRLDGERREEVVLVQVEQQQVTVDARLPLLRVDGDRAGDQCFSPVVGDT
jgi:hypothetical protein